MGQIKNNLVTKGFSGRVGDELVFRQVGDRTIVCKRPRKRSTLTPAQTAFRGNFKQAAYFARTALLDAATKAMYADAAKESNLPSAYVAAITDYMSDPKIADIFTSAYRGIAGDTLAVSAVHPFKVIEAVFTIKHADGTLVETGPAIAEAGGWKYVCKQANASVAGTKVSVTVKDRRNRAVSEERTL